MIFVRIWYRALSDDKVQNIGDVNLNIEPHLWKRTSALRRTAATLSDRIVVDVAVVGGGYTGLAAALGAQACGARVALLEGSTIGSGASGTNNGLVISHHNRASPREIEAMFGKKLGVRYNSLVGQAAEEVFALAKRFQIDAHQVQNGWIQPAHNAESQNRIRTFHDEWKTFGANVSWLDKGEVRSKVSDNYTAGWCIEKSGHINPYALASGLATALEQLSVTIFENTKVEKISRAGSSWDVITPSGTVSAQRVVLATNALTGDLWPGLKRTLIPIKIFEAATAPLEESLRAQILPGNPAVSDMHNDLGFFHYDRDFRIVSGGALTMWHREKQRAAEIVKKRLKSTFPMLQAPKITEYWTGVFAVVPDRIPKLYRLAPGLYFGGVYSGRGVALSLSLGQIIGKWALDAIEDDLLPLPVTQMQQIPFHSMAVQVANHIHPWHRFLDAKSR